MRGVVRVAKEADSPETGVVEPEAEIEPQPLPKRARPCTQCNGGVVSFGGTDMECAACGGTGKA